MGQIKFTRHMTLTQWEELFPDDDACKAYITRRRWPDGVIRCPRCQSDRTYALANRPFHWECPDCRKGGAYRFSVLVETIFEDTKVGLRTWFKVIYLVLTSKKGISALQVHRMMGFGSYQTAHSMCHRIRAGLIDPKFRQLMGIVEVDETCIGGKNQNRHWDKKVRGRGTMGKETVIGAVSRDGNVVARVLRNTDSKTLQGFVCETVSTKVDLLATDDYRGYWGLTEYPHQMVRDNEGQYAVGAIHTNTIEGFWSLIKRGIMGTFHKVSAKYLLLHVAEFEFRYDNRNNPDIFGTALGRC